jgi:hypothetical protein
MMNTATLLLSKLQSDLIGFGLNPTEWTIQKLHATHYLINHKSEEGFAFFGRLEYRNKRPHWKTIELYSI